MKLQNKTKQSRTGGKQKTILNFWYLKTLVQFFFDIFQAKQIQF